MPDKLKFSQRIGESPIKAIQFESVDYDLWVSLWNEVYRTLLKSIDEPQYGIVSGAELEFSSAIWTEFLKRPLNALGPKTMITDIYAIFSNGKWFEVYDFLEYIANANLASLSYLKRRDRIIYRCDEIFESEKAGYRFVDRLITPIVNQQEIETIEEAIENAEGTKLYGVREHLNSALKMLSDRKNPDYRNSMKESISAVESLACVIARKSDATLGDAPKIIKTKIALHGALENAFSSLYGYTSDEDGIRHKIVDVKEIGFEDAIFMLVSCSAFVNYLVSKCSKAGIKLS